MAFVLTSILAAILFSIATRITPHVRDRGVAALNERFRSKVETESLQVHLFPRPAIRGSGLTFRHNGRTDVTPLIRIGSYSASAGVWGLLNSPLHLRTVELDRLEITIPPGGIRDGDGRRPAQPTPAAGGNAPSSSGPSSGSRLIIDRVAARSARLAIVPRNRTKLPRLFEIHNLVMHGLGDEGGAAFEASLTNPTPRGDITTTGTIGPWSGEQPGQTPVRGDYVFKAANLDTIKGIAGTLSSNGRYSGVLERIDVQGETDTPDFSVDIAAQPVPLKTRFHAVVDGTNGDTWLERVEARVIETLIVARGAVVRAEDVKGRHTSLDVVIDDGRIEDVLKLAVKAANPLMTGRMRLKTRFLLPAGDRDVVEKLELDGTFSLNEARFSSVNVQKKINELSRRGKGNEGSDDTASVVSRLSGTFRLRAGTLAFSNLSFSVPGAVVQIAGSYDLRREALDFRGHLLLDATLAETTTGWKAVMARVAQPLFRRPGGGSKLPIRISGHPKKPEFGLDVKRALGPG